MRREEKLPLSFPFCISSYFSLSSTPPHPLSFLGLPLMLTLLPQQFQSKPVKADNNNNLKTFLANVLGLVSSLMSFLRDVPLAYW